MWSINCLFKNLTKKERSLQLQEIKETDSKNFVQSSLNSHPCGGNPVYNVMSGPQKRQGGLAQHSYALLYNLYYLCFHWSVVRLSRTRKLGVCVYIMLLNNSPQMTKTENVIATNQIQMGGVATNYRRGGGKDKFIIFIKNGQLNISISRKIYKQRDIFKVL